MHRRLLATAIATSALVVAMAAPAMAHEADETALPVGETVSEPTVGGLFTCQMNDPSVPGGGAQTEGPWFNGDGTWDATKKATVDGDVEWPQAEVTIKKDGDKRVITGNGLPVDHTTGEFPVSESDDAYQYDRNPNTISEQTISVEIPLNPELTDEPSCTGGGVIGYLKSGVPIFNAVDAAGRDAVAYEVQDECDGHPQQSGSYHYHSASSCVLDELDSGTGQSKLIGWALDGFGIYGPRDADGEELSSDDLDECHGITSTVKFNAKLQKIYHYVATKDYPYTVGCYKGTPATTTSPAREPGTGPGGSPPTGAPLR